MTETKIVTKMSWAGAWMPVIHRVACADGARMIGLTIDDGPTASTPALLELLRSAGVKATFFLSGDRMRRHPQVLRDIIADGHATYAHGMEHVRLDLYPPERIVEDMAAAESRLAVLRPTPEPYLVRLPYAAGRRLARVHRAIRAWSPTAQIAHWNISTEDHAIAPLCGDNNAVQVRCVDAVTRVLDRPDLAGSIVLMHDEPIGISGPYVSTVTLTIAELLIKALSVKGYTFATLRPIARPSLLSRFLLEK